MTNSTVSAIQQRADLRVQKGLGKGLARLFSKAIAERPPTYFLLLLAKADRKALSAK
jgi:hypothetical protein